MQSNVFSSVLSLKPGKKFTFWLKTAVFAGLLIYIGYVLQQQPFDWTLVREQITAVEHPEQWAAGLFLLTPVNWGFEALKWQILLQRIEKSTYWQAYKGVLAGVALGFALPALLGDTAGRVLSLRTHRAEAVGASLVSGGMQFYVALVFGAVAWAHHITVVPIRNNIAGQWLLVILVALSAGGIVFGLTRQRLVRWLEKRPGLRRFTDYWNVAGLYSDREIAQALGVAALRYVVFSVQFYLVMRLVGIHLSAGLSASSIGLVFLVKTITPAFNLLSDLGVREAASLWVFEPFSQTNDTVSTSVLLTATLTLWVANVLTPVLVGLIWVWKLKLTTE
uniref:lysylphosphatidylglycerol synthase domain-containing protein n=1 Tax=Spirosoma validum TaxID=2771355 RepID=UPI00293BD33A|nr:lysylphosphatidylglycerol synthase domain-containing protein [Spirosoma validum]